MPRTTVVESPGCPPLRALTTDILGLVKGSQLHFPFSPPLRRLPLLPLFALLRSTDSTRFPPVAVVEAHAKPAGAAKVVETWGAPDASRAIVAASLADRAADPVSIPFRVPPCRLWLLPDSLLIKECL